MHGRRWRHATLTVLRNAGLVTVDRVGWNQFQSLGVNRLGDVVARCLRSIGLRIGAEH